jgi:hypothetical protein
MLDGATDQRTSLVARRGSHERHNSALEQTARCAHVGSAPDYPVVRLYLASLSAHGQSATGQFMVGLK